MLSFRIRRAKFAIIAVACTLMLFGLDDTSANALDGVVMASDYGTRPVRSRRQRSTSQPRIRQASCTSDCCAGSCCCPATPWWAHRSSVWGEFLYLQATDADVAYAQQQNGIGGAGTVPFGRIGTVSQDHQPGLKVGLSKAFTNSSSLEMSYTFFESDAVDSLAAPIIPGGGGAIGSLVHLPGSSITSSTGPVNAAYDVDFQLANFSYRSLWKANDCFIINWSVGGQYGKLEQSFRQLGIYAGGNGGNIQTNSNIRFEGGGLKFGLDGERRLGGGGFSFYGRGNVSPMSGRFHANYGLNNNSINPPSNPPSLGFASWEDDRIVTLLDAEAGISWTGQQRKWRLSAGYQMSFWFNTVTTSSFISGVQAANYTDISDTLKFDGLTARIERRW